MIQCSILLSSSAVLALNLLATALGGYSILIILAMIMIGPLFALVMYRIFRNNEKRYPYETSTRKQCSNLKQSDIFVKRIKQQGRSKIEGANDKHIDGEIVSSAFRDPL